ncbi:TPA: TraU family protein [Legionella pneumophila]|nr:TraU family protein [Legionella pneumophila]
MRSLLIFLFMLISLSAFSAQDEVKSDDYITSVGIVAKIIPKLYKNLHYRIIGVCVWQRGWHAPTMTPEIEHFFPDLVVSSYQRPYSNPWLEINKIYENSTATKTQESIYKTVVGLKPSYGDSNTPGTSGLHQKRYLVDVVGSPYNLLRIPFALLRPETRPLKPYYLALWDLAVSRLQVVEIALSLRHLPNASQFVSGFPIGSALSIWGYEMPRHFITHTTSKFRAAMVAAMQGADLVTNVNSGHIVASTTNSCGKNCVVSNVTFDPNGKNVLWQEVFPNNRMITPGLEGHEHEETQDDIKGNGNYVFVVWRKYRGCVQDRGKLIYKTKAVGYPQKR